MAVRLDREAIQALQLDITAASVKAAICATARLRVKPPQITCGALGGSPSFPGTRVHGQLCPCSGFRWHAWLVEPCQLMITAADEEPGQAAAPSQWPGDKCSGTPMHSSIASPSSWDPAFWMPGQVGQSMQGSRQQEERPKGVSL